MPSPTFGPDQISHPTGATDIVLRMEQGGGFVPPGFLVTQSPTFTLYGDGTVIFHQLDTRADPFGSQAMLPWLVGHMSEADVQTLLQFALTTGRLAGARENYDNPLIADAGSTFFTLNAGGTEKVVSVYALSEMSGPGPDAADRNGFAQLAAVLSDFPNQSGLDLGDVVAFEPELYKVILLEGFGEPVGQPLDWPWEDLTVADWPDAEDPDGRIAFLDADHVAKLADVPNGGHFGVWVVAPDDTLVQFGIRPLLPDELAAHIAG